MAFYKQLERSSNERKFFLQEEGPLAPPQQEKKEEEGSLCRDGSRGGVYPWASQSLAWGLRLGQWSLVKS